tara:strand:- start:68 stop:253 length:186 start_codon:yes stop_codon:yes gene_type:complete
MGKIKNIFIDREGIGVESDLLDEHFFDQEPEYVTEQEYEEWKEHINTMENDPNLKDYYEKK